MINKHLKHSSPRQNNWKHNIAFFETASHIAKSSNLTMWKIFHQISAFDVAYRFLDISFQN